MCLIPIVLVDSNHSFCEKFLRNSFNESNSCSNNISSLRKIKNIYDLRASMNTGFKILTVSFSN